MSEHSAEKDRMRGTGGNRFIGTNPTVTDLLLSINDQLGDLREWAVETGRVLDLAEVTISTKRIPSGAVSVSVTADLADDLAHGAIPLREAIDTEQELLPLVDDGSCDSGCPPGAGGVASPPGTPPSPTPKHSGGSHEQYM